MCIAQIVSCVLFGQVAVQEDITLTNQSAAVREISVRALAGSIAQFMVMTRGVYEDIGFSFLAYRACFKKLMSLKSYLRIRTTFQITVQVALKKPLTLNYSGSVAFR